MSLSYLLGLLLTPAGGLYALLITAFLVVLNAFKKHFYAFALLALPGVLCHELLHFVVGLFLFARPTGISIIPKRVEGGYLLGSMMLNNVRWYNTVLWAWLPSPYCRHKSMSLFRESSICNMALMCPSSPGPILLHR